MKEFHLINPQINYVANFIETLYTLYIALGQFLTLLSSLECDKCRFKGTLVLYKALVDG